jgi:threonine/homoserine/homoserine lactone efflux protein
MILFLAGMLLSLFGSLPPGLISLSVARTSILRGARPAIVLGLGAAMAEFFQAWIAVVLADWFLAHTSVGQYFQWVAMLVFFSIGGYLMFFATPPPNVTGPSVSISLYRQFIKGALISAFNLLAIPYWFTYYSWLRMEGWWRDTGIASTLFFSGGVTIGTWLILLLYTWLGREIVNRSERVARMSNKLVGCIFLALGLKLLWDVVRAH